MADSDYNAIKPVEGLQTIQGVAPTQRRQERKPQQKEPERQQEETETEIERDEDATSPVVRNDDDPHSIDYCA